MLVVTGGSGKLGTELKKLFPDAVFPTREELDITIPYSIVSYFNVIKPTYILHCAAFTSPPRCNQNPLQTLKTNIIGTSYLVEYALQRNTPVAYISTEYVFDGRHGNYSEEDGVRPVNKYGWSKLAGESAIHLLKDYLIIRCAFTPKSFPYDKAPIDQYSSRLTVDKIAEQIYTLVTNGARGTYHIGGLRRSVYEIALETSVEEPIACLTREFDFIVPLDASLDTSKYTRFKESL